MLNEQQIIDLLTDDKLSADQLKQLRDEIDQNPGIKELVNIIDSLEYLAKEAHVDTITLSKYALFLNGDKTEESEIRIIAPKIEKHIQSCTKCKKEFELLNIELGDVDKFLNENISSPGMQNEAGNEKFTFTILQQYRLFRYSFAAAASIIILFGTLFVVSEITTPSYIKVSDNFNYSGYTSSRGRNSEDFSKAVDELADENYEEAINLFNADIENSKNDITIFYTHYVLGITHLRNAQNNFLGLFNSYDKSKLNRAEDSFKQVLQLNTSQMFENINYNTYFFLGQVYLLKGDFNKAESFLTKAIENNSEYSSEAKELLKSIS